MSKSEGTNDERDLTTLRAELGLVPTVVGQDQSLHAITPISVSIQGQSVTVWVPPSGKHAIRQRFKELARNEKRRAAEAGNSADTARLLAGSIGGALATSGVIALATASGPLAVAAVIATIMGAVIASAGLIAGHWMNRKKFEHEERMEYYTEVAEELKP